MGIALGLATALNWGVSDFCARFATHRIGTLRTMFYMQAVAFLLLTTLLALFGGWGHLADGSGWQPWAWGFFAGSINTISSLCLYRSFEVGKLAVVAPLSSSYPVLSVALSLATGERLTRERAWGIVLTLIGVVLVAAADSESGKAAARDGRPAQGRLDPGVAWALLSAVVFGGFFWLMGFRVVPRVGSVAAVWMIRLTCTLLTGIVILLAGQRIRPPRGNAFVWVAAMAVFDTSAFVFNNRGMQLEQVSVVSVLGSLYSAVTVALAAVVLREHLSRRQWMAIAMILCGICLIGL